MKIVLPYPPTVNTYWRNIGRGRTILSAEARRYRIEAITAARHQNVGFAPFEGSIAVEIVVFMPDARRRDLDNTLKPMLDALAYARVYLDDAQIDDLHIVRGGIDRKDPRAEICIEAA